VASASERAEPQLEIEKDRVQLKFSINTQRGKNEKKLYPF